MRRSMRPRPGRTETGAAIDGHRGGGLRHKRDALIASTARAMGAILGTDEKRIGAFARSFPDLVVWSPRDLADHLRSVWVAADAG